MVSVRTAWMPSSVRGTPTVSSPLLWGGGSFASSLLLSLRHGVAQCLLGLAQQTRSLSAGIVRGVYPEAEGYAMIARHIVSVLIAVVGSLVALAPCMGPRGRMSMVWTLAR